MATKPNLAFYHGAIAALAVVELYQQDTLFDEIVRTMDERELLRVARRNGEMRWSGLARYVRRQKEYKAYLNRWSRD